LAWAAAFLTMASARITEIGIGSSPIRKFSMARWVWAPQYRSAGTLTLPMESDSVRNFPDSVIEDLPGCG
jgi:hypothetical protein